MATMRMITVIHRLARCEEGDEGAGAGDGGKSVMRRYRRKDDGRQSKANQRVRTLR